VSEPVGTLLARARALREGRDRWHREAAQVVTELRARGLSFGAIREWTGIPEATAHRLSPTSDSAPSVGPS
jgi:hypothetical protein